MSECLKMYIERIQKMELNKLDKMLLNIDTEVSQGYLTCDEGRYLIDRLKFQYKILLNKNFENKQERK